MRRSAPAGRCARCARVERRKCLRETGFDGVKGAARGHHIVALERRARFLQSFFRRCQRLTQGPGRLGLRTRGGTSRCSSSFDLCGNRRDQALGFAAGQSLPGASACRGGRGALARVEGVAEGLTVVAFVDGALVAGEGRLGVGKFFAGERRRAGGAGSLDGSDGLVIFLLGRGVACRRGDQGKEHGGQTSHVSRVYRMKIVASHDRPREKLARSGAESLGDNELLAVVLGAGTRGLGALDVANTLLDAAGGLRGLSRMGRDELARTRGVGAARAARVQAAVELGRRSLAHDPAQRPQFLTPREVAEYLLPLFGSHPVERFGVLLLDTKHRLIRARIVSVGSLDASVAHPREVFREAILGGAAAIVLFHNHPSGDPAPSRDDIALTRRLTTAGDLIGVDVLDHVVLADGRYSSMRELERL